MEYTHYWNQTRNFTDLEWAQITTAAMRIIKSAVVKGIKLVNQNGEYGTDPIVSCNEIALNGVKEDSCDTFYLARTLKGNRWSVKKQVWEHGESFCKTNGKPYDSVVVSILAAAKGLAPTAIKVTSDGGDEAIKMQFPEKLSVIKIIDDQFQPVSKTVEYNVTEWDFSVIYKNKGSRK